MNIFSLLVAIAVCITVAGLPYILSIYPITVKIVHKSEYDNLITPSNTIPAAEFEKEHVKLENDKTQEVKNMDSVIAAVNQMFGVAVEDNTNEKE